MADESDAGGDLGSLEWSLRARLDQLTSDIAQGQARLDQFYERNENRSIGFSLKLPDLAAFEQRLARPLTIVVDTAAAEAAVERLKRQITGLQSLADRTAATIPTPRTHAVPVGGFDGGRPGGTFPSNPDPVARPEPVATGSPHGPVGVFSAPAEPRSRPAPGFTKRAIQQRLVDAYAAQGGGFTLDHEKMLERRGFAVPEAFTFHRKLPTEIRDFMQGRPELRKLFRVSKQSAGARGADAFGALGDDYLSMAEAAAGSPVEQALSFAKKSPDPQLRLDAALYENYPLGAMRTKLDKRGRRSRAPARIDDDLTDLNAMEPGSRFTVRGLPSEVAEDEEGHRVLRGHGFDDIPVQGLGKVPVDRGSVLPPPEVDLDAIAFGDDAHTPAAEPASFYDADKAGTSKTGMGLYGQQTADAATGNETKPLFHQPGDAAAADDASPRIGSASASDPRHTSEMFPATAAEAQAKAAGSGAGSGGPPPPAVAAAASDGDDDAKPDYGMSHRPNPDGPLLPNDDPRDLVKARDMGFGSVAEWRASSDEVASAGEREKQERSKALKELDAKNREELANRPPLTPRKPPSPTPAPTPAFTPDYSSHEAYLDSVQSAISAAYASGDRETANALTLASARGEYNVDRFEAGKKEHDKQHKLRTRAVREQVDGYRDLLYDTVGQLAGDEFDQRRAATRSVSRRHVQREADADATAYGEGEIRGPHAPSDFGPRGPSDYKAERRRARATDDAVAAVAATDGDVDPRLEKASGELVDAILRHAKAQEDAAVATERAAARAEAASASAGRDAQSLDLKRFKNELHDLKPAERASRISEELSQVGPSRWTEGQRLDLEGMRGQAERQAAAGGGGAGGGGGLLSRTTGRLGQLANSLFTGRGFVALAALHAAGMGIEGVNNEVDDAAREDAAGNNTDRAYAAQMQTYRDRKAMVEQVPILGKLGTGIVGLVGRAAGISEQKIEQTQYETDLQEQHGEQLLGRWRAARDSRYEADISSGQGGYGSQLLQIEQQRDQAHLDLQQEQKKAGEGDTAFWQDKIAKADAEVARTKAGEGGLLGLTGDSAAYAKAKSERAAVDVDRAKSIKAREDQLGQRRADIDTVADAARQMLNRMRRSDSIGLDAQAAVAAAEGRGSTVESGSIQLQAELRQSWLKALPENREKTMRTGLARIDAYNQTVTRENRYATEDAGANTRSIDLRAKEDDYGASLNDVETERRSRLRPIQLARAGIRGMFGNGSLGRAAGSFLEKALGFGALEDGVNAEEDAKGNSIRQTQQRRARRAVRENDYNTEASSLGRQGYRFGSAVAEVDRAFDPIRGNKGKITGFYDLEQLRGTPQYDDMFRSRLDAYNEARRGARQTEERAVIGERGDVASLQSRIGRKPLQAELDLIHSETEQANHGVTDPYTYNLNAQRGSLRERAAKQQYNDEGDLTRAGMESNIAVAKAYDPRRAYRAETLSISEGAKNKSLSFQLGGRNDLADLALDEGRADLGRYTKSYFGAINPFEGSLNRLDLGNGAAQDDFKASVMKSKKAMDEAGQRLIKGDRIDGRQDESPDVPVIAPTTQPQAAGPAAAGKDVTAKSEITWPQGEALLRSMLERLGRPASAA